MSLMVSGQNSLHAPFSRIKTFSISAEHSGDRKDLAAGSVNSHCANTMRMNTSGSSSEVQIIAQLNGFSKSYSSWFSGDTAPTALALQLQRKVKPRIAMLWDRLAVPFADSEPNNS